MTNPGFTLPLIILIFLVCPVCAQNLAFETNLPIVYLNTGGQIISDTPKISSKMEIAWNTNGEPNRTSDIHFHFIGDIKIETRGSSSQNLPKKSYGFELIDSTGADLDFPLLGMPKESDWILFAPYNDKTLTRNVFTLTLASQLSNSYVPRCRYVELFLNQQYEGIYVLMEKIKRDSSRVDIAKLKAEDLEGEELTGGYIVKIDKKTGSWGEGWVSDFYNMNNTKTFYQYEYPKFDEIQDNQKNYIKNFISDFEFAVFNHDDNDRNSYLKYINRQSFFDFVIINEISRNVDGYRLSTFLFKEKNGPLHAGPFWDFDRTFGNANYYSGLETNGLALWANLKTDNNQVPFWWKFMCSDAVFANPMQCRWKELRNSILSNARINTVLDSLIDVIEPARERNFNRWPIMGIKISPNYYVGLTYADEVAWMKNWIRDRLNYLDQSFPGICPDEIQGEVDGLIVNVFPNPFNTKINLEIGSDSFQTFDFQLFSANGSLMENEKITVTKGWLNKEIETSNLNSGMYFYRVVKENTVISSGKAVKF
jgi:hypothetical protein